MARGHKIGMMAAACLTAVAVQAESSYWQGTSGGDLANGTWSPSLTQDKNIFNTAQSAPLTLSADYDGLYWPYFNKNAQFILDLNGHTLTVPHRLHVEGGSSGSSLSRVYIKNGTVAMKSGADRIFIGDQTMYNQLVVDSGGKLDATGSGYIFVGNNKIYNCLVVREGGALEGAVNVGNKANASTVEITGTGSTWTSADARSILIGDGGASCSLSVADGGKATIQGELRVGYGQNATGTRVTVGDRGVLELGGAARFGVSGGSATVDLRSGGRIELTAANTLNLGENSTANDCTMTVAGLLRADFTSSGSVTNWAVGANASRCKLLVASGGVVAVTNATWNVGYAAAAKNNLLQVETGGAMRLACPSTTDERLNVGLEGSENTLRLNDGILDAPGCAVILGGKLAGSSNLFTVENGGSARVRRVIVGDKGPSNALCVSNANLTVSSSLDAGYSAVDSGSNPMGCTITVKGRDSRIQVGETVRLRNDAALIYKMTSQGYATAPVTCNALEAAAAARIQIDLDGELPSARDIPLLVSNIDISDTVISRLRATAVVPPHTSLRFSARAINLHVSGGLVILFK